MTQRHAPSKKTFKSASFALVLVILALLTAQSAAAAAVQSDDFHATELDTTLWDVVDPVGDATILMTGTNLLIHVRPGASHNLWASCNCAPRLLQTVDDTDFEIQAKFDSKPNTRYQIQGFVILEDDDTYLRFDVHHDGTSPRIFAGYINGINPPSIKINAALAAIPTYLKVTRTGSVWDFRYSNDGTNWTSAGSFSRGIIVTQLGLFAGTTQSNDFDSPPFVANVDYFFSTASPIIPEDGGAPTAPTLPVVDAWYGDTQGFGQMGVPQQWVNIVGTVWDTDDIESLSYQLNGGPSIPLPMGPDDFRLAQPGDFNIEIDFADLTSGPNNLIVTAVDTLGEQTDHPVTINYTDGVTWALPYTASFSTATEVPDEAHVVDGRWHLTGAGVRTDSSATGYDRTLVLGDRTWSPDYEVTVPLTLNRADIGGPTGIAVAIGWQGSTGAERPRLAKQYQALARILDVSTSPILSLKDMTTVQAQDSIVFEPGVRYNLKLRSQSIGAGLARVDAKFWEDGTPEPAEYILTYDFARHEGSVALMAKYCDVTFGDVTVTPLASAAHALTTTAVGNGSISRSPDYDLYPDSTVVLVTAVPDPGYSFVGWSDGLSGRTNPDTVMMLSDTTVTATFVEGIQSDDFYGPVLNTSLWRYIDPRGDATLTMTGTNLTVYIPGGIDHSLTTTGINAPRIMQDAPDGNFEIEAKFGSRGSYTYQGQGILVQEDDDTYIRFDLVYTSSGTQVFVGFFDAGVLTTISISTPPDPPSYLRLSRAADTWKFKYSTDGTTWTTDAVYQKPLTVTEAGVFFNNTGSLWKTPAFVGNIDYFFNTSQPIIPEDDGSPSAATPPVVDVWYGDTQSFGDLGIPQMWANLLGNVWDSDSVVTLSYRLNEGPNMPLNMGPDGKRLIGVGDFNAEIDYNDLVPGENSVVITAIDELGEQTDHVVTLNYTPGITWEIPYTADWASAAEVTDVGHVGDGRWAITPEGIRTDVGGVGYDRFVVIGDYRWLSDYEVVLPMTIHMGNPPGGAGVGLAIGWQGHIGSNAPGADFVQPQLENRYQTIGWVRNIPDNTILQLKDDELTRGEISLDMLEGVRYILKIRSEHTAPGHAQVSVKIWEDGTTEPGWQLTDDFAPRDGSVALIAHQADVTFGTVSITPLGSFPLHTLDVSINGSGTVTRVPNYATYPDSAQVQLTAVADEGWLFTNWTGGVTSASNPLSIIMRSDTSITANFMEVPFTVTRNVVGSGWISLNPDEVAYASGDTVIVTAHPNSGWAFSSWSDGLSGIENPDTIIVVSDTTITANFLQGAFTVDVVIAGNGRVIIEPTMASYMPGDTITLAAEPDSGYYFYGWSGSHEGTASPDTVTVDADMRIIATFFATITGIDSPPSIRTLTVLQNSPNPFTRNTYLEFGLPEPTEVDINVYDVAGRRVFSDHVPGASAGWNRFLFDGRDRGGKPLPSGVYFYQIRTHNKAVTKKMVIVR